MIALHPHFLVDREGHQTAVQVPVEEFRSLVLTAFADGHLGEGAAAAVLGLSRAAFYDLAAQAGLSTCTYSTESVEAELAHL
jgi:hypothetical protein